MYKLKPGVTQTLQAMLYQNVEKNEWVLFFDYMYMYVVICTPFYNCVTTGPLQQQQKQQQRQRLVKIYLNKIME